MKKYSTEYFDNDENLDGIINVHPSRGEIWVAPAKKKINFIDSSQSHFTIFPRVSIQS